MKQFAIQAICDEKVLWEIMQCLEEKRCTGIMTRPLLNGAASTKRKASELTRIDAALEVMRSSGKTMTPTQLRDALQERGYSGPTGGMLHVLQERKLVGKVGKGMYRITKKGAA